MARLGHEAFQIDAGIPKACLRGALNALERGGEGRGVSAKLHADAATASGRFQHHGIADGLRGGKRFLDGTEQVGAGQKRHTACSCQRAGSVFQAEIGNIFRFRADKGDTFGRQPFGKADIFGKEAIAGMNGFGACCLAGGNHRLHVEIAFGGGRRAKPHRLIGHQRRHGKAVGVGINGDRGDAHFLQRANDAHGDFAAIGDQNLPEHGAQPSSFQTRTRMGVGSKPLQGLLICGQLEMTSSTSISAFSST